MRACITILLLLTAGAVRGPAQGVADHGCSTKGTFLARTGGPASTGDPGIDVTHYRLDLRLVPAGAMLHGVVRVTARVVADSLATVTLDLASPMALDSIRMGADRTPFTRYPGSFVIHLPRTLRRGDVLSADIFYHGTPDPTGFGSFRFASRPEGPWIWSLSQPYGARDWWPCKDHPLDKADSTDIFITCPNGLKAGSNGSLVATTDNGDGTTTFHWSGRYPIATYLVSITVGPFVEFSNWFHYGPSDSMEVLNYVLSSSLPEAGQQLPKTVGMLEIFSRLYGPYPFLKEKYGHCQFGRGGAMEHQTMTSTTTFDEDVLAHELAHQWFGDLITCRTWQDLWLNEGFATYSESLHREQRYGTAEYRRLIRARMIQALAANGSLFVTDTTTVGNLFAVSRVYAKGASVLHMLRRVMGDSLFFRAIRAYADEPHLRYATASTADFQAVCESVYGRSLGFFFTQWIYGEKFPRYTLHWSAHVNGTTFRVDARLDQETRTSTPLFFTMPVEIRFSSDNADTTVTLWNDRQSHAFTVDLPFRPVRAEVDPDMWILREVLDPAPPLPAELALAQNYPNPFNAGTAITVAVPQRTPLDLAVHSVLGARVATIFRGTADPGIQTYTWDARDDRGLSVAAGVYFYRIVAGARTITRSMILIR